MTRTEAGKRLLILPNGTSIDPDDGVALLAAIMEAIREGQAEAVAAYAARLQEWLDYAKQPKVPEMDSEWADGYRQGWVAAWTLMETKMPEAGR